MKVHLDYRAPTQSHCGVAVFIDGALTGTLTLRQTDLISFQTIICAGLLETDEFLATGNPDPPEGWGGRDLLRGGEGRA